jgi:flagellar biosynthesis protein FliR
MFSFFTWLLIFFRAGAFLLVIPLFSGPNVPVRLRLALSGFLSLMLVPVVPNPVDLTTASLVGMIFMVAHEIFVGLFLGYISRMIFFAVQLTGHFISTDIGLQTSTLITPVDSVPVDVPGAVLNLLAMMLFLSLDVHHTIIVAFQETFQALPLGGARLSNALFDDVTMRIARVILLSVQMAAPLMAVGFLLGIVLMMLGRAVPQMNIFFESFTIRLLAGLLVFGFSMNLLAQRIANFLGHVPEHMLEVSRTLGGA